MRFKYGGVHHTLRNIYYGLRTSEEALLGFRMRKENLELRPELIGLWKVHVDPSYRVPSPQGLPYPAVFFTWKGRGSIELPFNNRRNKTVLEPGSIFFVKAGQPCFYECPRGECWFFYCLHFVDPSTPAAFGLEYNVAYMDLSTNFLKNICESMIEEMTRNDLGYKPKSDSLMTDLFVSASRSRKSSKERKTEPVKQLKLWMDRHLHEQISITQVLRASGMTRTSLFRLFKNREGVSPMEYFTKMKLESARDMLTNTSLKIYEIAEHFHFYDEYHFSRAFKERFGESPQKMRKRRIGVRADKRT